MHPGDQRLVRLLPVCDDPYHAWMLLSKFLTALVYPLTLHLLLGALGLALRRRWPRLGLFCCGLGLAWLLLWSLPVTTSMVSASLEQQYPQKAPADLPVVDAIVVLGGGVGQDEYGVNLYSAADRVWFGARLFRAGRAPLVILSGGGSEEMGTIFPEAPAMATFIEDLGVPASALLLESESRTTRENAVATAQLLEARAIHRVLLVTSAQHMPRAVATFRALGIDAIPAPTDFESSPPRSSWLLRWTPDAASLDRSSRALKEYVGLWIYRLRGWA